MPARLFAWCSPGELGAGWRASFPEFDDQPPAAAAASARSTGPSGMTGARSPSRSSTRARAGTHGRFESAGRFARLFAGLSPGLDVKPLLAELRDRVSEELDYRREADAQRAFAAAYAGDPDICVPGVVAVRDQVLVTEWLEGIPLRDHRRRTRSSGTGRACMLVRSCSRVRAGRAAARRSAPGQLPAARRGRLGVLDFGAVDRLAGGPADLRPGAAADARRRGLWRSRRGPGPMAISGTVSAGSGPLRDFLAPLAEPSRAETFRFSREWLRVRRRRRRPCANPACCGGSTCRRPTS